MTMRFFCLIVLTSIQNIGSFFIPIARSSSVSKIAKSIKLEDSTIVVSRNSTGDPVAFHDFCGHRGASFDNVVLKQDTIACPYHGFLFDANDGILKSGLGVKSGCSSLKMIECRESSGLIWVCIDGDDSIKPPPELTEESDPTFRKISGIALVKCPVEQLVGNVIDFSHINVVHSFGNKIDPEPLNYKAQKVSDTHGSATFQYDAGKNSMFDGLLDIYNWYDVPCTAGTMVTSGNRVKIVRVNAVQLSEGYTKVFWELYRNWSTEHYMDSIFEMAMRITLKEDKEILEKCNFEKGYKFHGTYDKLQLLYIKSLIKCKKPIL